MPLPGPDRASADAHALDDLLSHPTEALVQAMETVRGDLVILGAGGKMGPSLARLTRRATRARGVRRRIVAVSRFANAAVRDELERHDVETRACDLLDRAVWPDLPDAPLVVFMAGRKFGTADGEERTWATNAYLPSLAAERYPESRIVAFSTGNVYPLTAIAAGGSREDDPAEPIGEYAQSALARERLLTFFANRNGTPMALLRLNYAVEPRYGVLRDVADRVWRREPISLAMGHVNVIWQRDANAVALRAFAHCATPPFVLNVTGPETISVRRLAQRFGEQFEIDPVFEGEEAATALLSNASRCASLFGPPEVTLDDMIVRTADWVRAGGASLGRPTHFSERGGRF